MRRLHGPRISCAGCGGVFVHSLPLQIQQELVYQALGLPVDAIRRICTIRDRIDSTLSTEYGYVRGKMQDAE